MREKLNDARLLWLAVGLVGGLCISYFWPHETALAATADRSDQFAMASVGVNLIDPIEGVFVLDFPTNSLRGAVLNRQTRRFTSFYYRDLSHDFNINPQSEPHFAFITGNAQVAGGGGITFASGMLYVGELKSGKIICYAFPWKEMPVPGGVIPMVPIDSFRFREAAEQ